MLCNACKRTCAQANSVCANPQWGSADAPDFIKAASYPAPNVGNAPACASDRIQCGAVANNNCGLLPVSRTSVPVVWSAAIAPSLAVVKAAAE